MLPWKRFILCLFFAREVCAFTTQRHVFHSQHKATLPIPAIRSDENKIRFTAALSSSQRKHASNLQGRARVLFARTAVNQDETKSESATENTSKEEPIKNNNNAEPRSLPWSEFHDWALRDNLPKYIRILPGETPKIYALWRTMLQEVPELSGYPIAFLQGKYAAKPLKQEPTNNNSTGASAAAPVAPDSVPETLAFLDNFYFEPSGGLSGQVYGVAGLRDGTSIETSPVGQVEVTIPLGYVLTEDIGIAYELGKPHVAEAEIQKYSIDGVTQMTRKAGQAAGSMSEVAASSMAAMTQNSASNGSGNSIDPDGMLVKMGASAGILLTGAIALSMLSHHLTLNVFWV